MNGNSEWFAREKHNQRTSSVGTKKWITKVSLLLPGVLLCAGLAIVTAGTHALVLSILGGSSLLLIAIVVGCIAANVWQPSRRMFPGVQMCGSQLLKIGVALLGLSIPFSAITSLGWQSLTIIATVVIGGFSTALVCGKLLRLSHSQSLLIGAGCSICGASAIAATYAVLGTKRQHECATAIAVITVFGTIMIVLAPAIVSGWEATPAGLLIGATTHEVSQTVAAGSIVGDTVLPIAVAAKLGRVLLLAPVVVLIGFTQRGHHTTGRHLVPGFLACFIILVLCRSLLPIPESVLSVTDTARTIIFCLAMIAQGLQVTWPTVRRAGARPVVLGVTASAAVVTIAWFGVWVVP